MARRERERYTERTRQGGRPASKPGDSAASASDRQVDSTAMVYAGGGALVVVLALIAFMVLNRNRVATPGASPTTAASSAITNTTESAITTSKESSAASGGVTDTSAAKPPAPAAGTGKQWAAPEDQKLDPATKAYFATIETKKGAIVVQLFPDVAPQHVNNFIFLARQGFYDGTTFHRVIPGFMAQGGDPTGSGQGGPGYTIPAEFNAANPVPHRIGSLAMARTSDPNSAGSQFYIVNADGPSATGLNGQYTVFGHVVKGLKNVLAISPRDPQTASTPGDEIVKITIEEKPKSESIVTADDIRQGKLPAND